jgi:hypothetical protein
MLTALEPAYQEPSHGSEPAGLDISGKVVEVDVDSYDSYKTFEIEFENSPSMDCPTGHNCSLPRPCYKAADTQGENRPG